MASILKATLVGGPCDGKIVEVIGIVWEQRFPAKYGSARFIRAVYGWANGSNKSIIGVFDGYYDGTTRVDKLGRRIAKKGRVKLAV